MRNGLLRRRRSDTPYQSMRTGTGLRPRWHVHVPRQRVIRHIFSKVSRLAQFPTFGWEFSKFPQLSKFGRAVCRHSQARLFQRRRLLRDDDAIIDDLGRGSCAYVLVELSRGSHGREHVPRSEFNERGFQHPISILFQPPEQRRVQHQPLQLLCFLSVKQCVTLLSVEQLFRAQQFLFFAVFSQRMRCVRDVREWPR